MRRALGKVSICIAAVVKRCQTLIPHDLKSLEVELDAAYRAAAARAKKSAAAGTSQYGPGRIAWVPQALLLRNKGKRKQRETKGNKQRENKQRETKGSEGNVERSRAARQWAH